MKNEAKNLNLPTNYRHERARTTTWVNPTDVVQVIVMEIEGKTERLVIPPKGELEVASKYDHVIQTCTCNEGCQDQPRYPEQMCATKDGGRGVPGGGTRDPWCKHPDKHKITVLGGKAPMLLRKGKSVDDMSGRDLLDPEVIEKKRLEAEQSAAEIARAAAEDRILIAEARKQKVAKSKD